MIKYLLLVLFAVQTCISPAVAQPIKLDCIPHNPGMFSVFNTIAGMLYLFDNKQIEGFQVDFGTTGRYYDSEHTPNWWEYFCEPIKLGNMTDHKVPPSGMCGKMAVFAETQLSRDQVHALIAKYVHFKPYILSEVDLFIKESFRNWHVIGIHYRGTDKKMEAPRIAFKNLLISVKEEINKVGKERCKIFIATDEIAFINFMKQHFPKKVIFQNATRSVDKRPIHENMTNVFEQGKEAILDMLLLSKCNVLIRCSSNLSLWSGYMNPEMPIIMLNQRRGL